MDVSDILDQLNDAQREAVTAPPGYALVLAGAGSGKTRVLVHRIAWLVRVENISPYGILAVTFTNKAALEMRQRIEALLGVSLAGMWVGTFHGICHRLLRQHWEQAGLTQSFQILDTQDQLRLIKRILKDLGLDDAKWPPKQALWFINSQKEEGLRAKHIAESDDHTKRQLIQVYSAYEQMCQRLNVVDFAELLLKALEILRENPDLLSHYQNRLQHLLVDEFQDTNAIQYAFLRLLAGDTGQVFAVGDDDQSIYGWRGARIENIQDFSKHFANTRLIKLEQNYRSSGNILKAANTLIDHNAGRLGKQLWTDSGDGSLVDLYSAYNEQDEAKYIAERIQQWVNQGGQRKEVAILYRSNAQSRVFEETFLATGIPYRVYGGLRYFERAEIKDALAYLRLCVNRKDDTSFDRIVNMPPRGIGERTLDIVRTSARSLDISLWEASQICLERQEMSARAGNAINGFLQLIGDTADSLQELPLFEQVDHLLHASGLLDYHSNEKNEKAQARKENLQELVSAAKAFIYEAELEEGLSPLDSFLAHAALESGEGQGDAWEDCVQMMTLHSAKGLEFPLVMLCGLEEGLFPHQMSLEEPGRIEEERRLCYVGITRAKEHLILSYAESRRLYGKENYSLPSRFVSELPQELLQEIRPRVKVNQPLFNSAPKRSITANHPDGFNIGQRVTHKKFGEGIVLNFEGQGNHARVQVNFESAGGKWLVLAYANLQLL